MSVVQLGRGRPRKPSISQEMSGAFDKNPQRRRYDPETRPLSPDAPKEFGPELRRVWEDVLDEMPRITIGHSDYRALVQLVRMIHLANKSFEAQDMETFFKADEKVRQWLMHFGMTPATRAKFATKEKPNGDNPFNKI